MLTGTSTARSTPSDALRLHRRHDNCNCHASPAFVVATHDHPARNGWGLTRNGSTACPSSTTEATAPTESETPLTEQQRSRPKRSTSGSRTLAEQKKASRTKRPDGASSTEIEDAQKSETEKAADRIAKAEAEVASVPNKVADALREHLVALHEIDKDDAELFLTSNDPELLLKQVTRLVGQSDKRKKTPNVVPGEGKTPSNTPGDADRRAFVRQLTGRE